MCGWQSRAPPRHVILTAGIEPCLLECHVQATRPAAPWVRARRRGRTGGCPHPRPRAVPAAPLDAATALAALADLGVDAATVQALSASAAGPEEGGSGGGGRGRGGPRAARDARDSPAARHMFISVIRLTDAVLRQLGGQGVGGAPHPAGGEAGAGQRQVALGVGSQASLLAWLIYAYGRLEQRPGSQHQDAIHAAAERLLPRMGGEQLRRVLWGWRDIAAGLPLDVRRAAAAATEVRS